MDTIKTSQTFKIFKLFMREFWLFGIKQAAASIFGGYLLFMIVTTRYLYPETWSLARYDFLFLSAVLFQIALLAFKFETRKEAFVIIVFHIVATIMEVFKTSKAIGSWHYPGEFKIGIGNVPLFAGFMYSAVGSYLSRVWRIFHFQFSHYPPIWMTLVLVSLIYINFFSHHYIMDIRWGLLLATFMLYGRCWIYFKMDKKHRKMPLVVGFFLVSLFIWIAENLSTFAGIWLYPAQNDGWRLVPINKWLAWYLLMLLSFVLITLVHPPTFKLNSAEADDQNAF